MDTDYDTYALVYGCGSSDSTVFMIARTPTISDELQDELVEKFKKMIPDFDWSRFCKQDYQGPLATYLPEPFTGSLK